ncbi:hypothetical protein D3C71_888170 [compost metagenome]
MKKVLLSLLLLGFNHLYAQEVELSKENKVIVDGKEVLKYEKIDNWQYSFYNLGGDEILMFKYQNNQTQDDQTDDYFTLNFLTRHKKVETSDFSLIYAANSKKNMQKLIKLLMKEKVLDMNGVIDTNKLDVFYEKYNQKIK